MILSQVFSPINWENQFSEEALAVEELLSLGDVMNLNKSKLSIAFENRILSWQKFKTWIETENKFLALKTDLDNTEIQRLKKKYAENKKTFSHYGIWSSDLIAIEFWDEHLIVIGLAPIEKLASIPKCIFVLCPPIILNEILDLDHTAEKAEENSAVNNLNTSTKTENLLQFDQDISKPIDLSFSNLMTSTQNENTPDLNAQKTDITQNNIFSSIPILQTEPINPTNIAVENIKKSKIESTQTAYTIWNLIDTNHIQHSEIARKQFDAYAVLRVIDNKTYLYKMDEDLQKEDLNEGLFKYDLTLSNPFSEVAHYGTCKSFTCGQLGLQILDFKYVCITPLKLANTTIGFLVGFKISKLLKQDENVLEQISFENAA